MTTPPLPIVGRVFAVAAIAATSGQSPTTARVIAADDDTSAPPGDTGGGVNDQGQNSGDVFTQNAQDQSTA